MRPVTTPLHPRDPRTDETARQGWAGNEAHIPAEHTQARKASRLQAPDGDTSRQGNSTVAPPAGAEAACSLSRCPRSCPFMIALRSRS